MTTLDELVKVYEAVYTTPPHKVERNYRREGVAAVVRALRPVMQRCVHAGIAHRARHEESPARRDDYVQSQIDEILGDAGNAAGGSTRKDGSESGVVTVSATFVSTTPAAAYLCSPLCAGYLRAEAAEAEVVRLRGLLNSAEKDCHKARFALQTIGESTVPDQPASSGLSELEHAQHHHTQLRRLAIMTLRPEAIGIYEAPRREADEIRVRGVGRDLFEPRSVRIALTERPTDDEIISMHNWMRGWKL